jgi:predicted AAA+ superfamily ATPase
VLGSAAIDLLRQSSESLTGRIECVDLGPLNVLEIGDRNKNMQRLWLRGGCPDSYLAKHYVDSFRNRRSFIRTYIFAM